MHVQYTVTEHYSSFAIIIHVRVHSHLAEVGGLMFSGYRIAFPSSRGRWADVFRIQNSIKLLLPKSDFSSCHAHSIVLCWFSYKWHKTPFATSPYNWQMAETKSLPWNIPDQAHSILTQKRLNYHTKHKKLQCPYWYKNFLTKKNDVPTVGILPSKKT
jgi:hypothetical protein